LCDSQENHDGVTKKLDEKPSPGNFVMCRVEGRVEPSDWAGDEQKNRNSRFSGHGPLGAAPQGYEWYEGAVVTRKGQ